MLNLINHLNSALRILRLVIGKINRNDNYGEVLRKRIFDVGFSFLNGKVVKGGYVCIYK